MPFSKTENRHLKKQGVKTVNRSEKSTGKKTNCLVIQRNHFFVKGLSVIEKSINDFFKFDDGVFALSRAYYLKNI